MLTTAREAAQATPSPSPATGPQAQTTDSGQERARDIPGPLQHTLLSLGITSPALLARSADLDHASQQLLIDAATDLAPTCKRPPATVLNQTPASAAFLNHALATSGTQAAELLRRSGHAIRDEPELEPEP